MDTKQHHDVPHQPPPLQQPAYQHPSDQEPMPIQQHPPPPQAQGIPPPEPSNQVAVTAEENRDLDPRGQEWQFGLFSCFGDMKSSLLGCCLPCVLHGRTMDRIKDPSLQSHDPLNSECIVWSAIQCFTGCGCLYNLIKRGEIRNLYGIHGSGFSDCCTSYWCLCCALVQQDREVALRAGNQVPVMQGYQAQKEGMHMPGAGQPPLV
ncbi:hypothetical protein E4U28_008153 [Claviceps purpurea]|nr:hypothetical protein E4U28_008153 [Claviceps purpurea]